MSAYDVMTHGFCMSLGAVVMYYVVAGLREEARYWRGRADHYQDLYDDAVRRLLPPPAGDDSPAPPTDEYPLPVGKEQADSLSSGVWSRDD